MLYVSLSAGLQLMIFVCPLQEELEREGLWDFQRLSTPYVRCHILIRKFGDRWTEIADKYFDEFEHLCYQFKEQYNTEKKIVAATTLEDDAPESAVQEAEADQARLFDLLHVNFNRGSIFCSKLCCSLHDALKMIQKTDSGVLQILFTWMTEDSGLEKLDVSNINCRI